MIEIYKGVFAVDNMRGLGIEEIVFNATDAIFVTDGDGVVLLAQEEVKENMGAEMCDIIGSKVDDLVDHGMYTRSTSRESIDKKQIVNGLFHTRNGRYLFSTSKPILNEDGSIRYIVTNTRDYGVMEAFLADLEREKGTSEKYIKIANYLQETRANKAQPLAASGIMQQTLLFCKSIARSDSVVLLTGETGTGKEVCAEYIFENSQRSQEPFLPINCSAIPPELVEAELFGYERGAFTGADPKGHIGLIEMANHGTIFLDEVGELPLHVQPKLLRFLENGKIKRVGGSKEIPVDVRVISATNRDLQDMVNKDLLREDLYYRLNVVPITLPPLRERKEDIKLLAEHFLSKYNRRYGKNMSLSEAMKVEFLRYSWPGNIRELRNVIERIVVTADENFFTFFPANKKPDMSILENEQKADDESILPLRQAAQEFETQYISKAVERCGGNITKAAKLLGIHRTLIYKKGFQKKG